jgi:hypothetical protein
MPEGIGKDNGHPQRAVKPYIKEINGGNAEANPLLTVDIYDPLEKASEDGDQMTFPKEHAILAPYKIIDQKEEENNGHNDTEEECAGVSLTGESVCFGIHLADVGQNSGSKVEDRKRYPDQSSDQ